MLITMVKEVEMSDEKKAFWAIIQLMGHATIAGYLEEDEIAGHGMLKITVPETSTSKQFHRFVEPKAVYSIDPVDELTARAKAERIQYKPIDEWDIRPMLEDIVKKADASTLLKMRPDIALKVIPEQAEAPAPVQDEIAEVEYEELEVGFEYKTQGGWTAIVDDACDDKNGLYWVAHHLLDGEIIALRHEGNGVPCGKQGVVEIDDTTIILSTKKPVEKNG